MGQQSVVDTPLGPAPTGEPGALRRSEADPSAPGPAWLLALMAANTVAAVGLFGDIARHVSLTSAVEDESFLAGWHLVLYGGVAGAAAVLGLLAVVHGPWAPWRMLPLATSGAALLTLGGATDMVWHELYGVEAAFEALVSPPHLVIFAGLVLLMVAPVAAVAEGPRQPLDAAGSVVVALSITSVLLVISLFTGYLTPLIGGSELQAGAYEEPLIGTSRLDEDVARGLGVALWFSALVSLVTVAVRRRTAPLVGTWTLAFGLLGIAPLVANGSDTLPLAVGLVVFGVATDVAGLRGPPHPVLTGLTTGVLWLAVFLALMAEDRLLWSGVLWTGVVTSSTLVGAALAGLVRWSAPRDPAASR